VYKIHTISVKEILENSFENEVFLRYDLVIKYMFIDTFMKKKKLKKKFERFKLYHLLYLDKSPESAVKHHRRFIPIIKSFAEKGYDMMYPLHMSRQYHLQGGSHRLSCCLWFDIYEVPIVFIEGGWTDRKRRYTKKWMKKHKFRNHIKKIDAVKNQILKNHL